MARPAIEDESVQAEAGARGRQPPGRPGTDAACRANAGHPTPGQTKRSELAHTCRRVEAGRYMTVTDRKGSTRDRRRLGFRHGRAGRRPRRGSARPAAGTAHPGRRAPLHPVPGGPQRRCLHGTGLPLLAGDGLRRHRAGQGPHGGGRPGTAAPRRPRRSGPAERGDGRPGGPVHRADHRATRRVADRLVPGGAHRAARAGHDAHRGDVPDRRAAPARAGGVPGLRLAPPARSLGRTGRAGRRRRGDGRPPARRRLRRPGRVHAADPPDGGGGARRAGRGLRDHGRRPGGRERRTADQDPRRRGAVRRRRRRHGRRDRAAADRDHGARRDDAGAARRHGVRHGDHPYG